MLSGFELYPRWVPLSKAVQFSHKRLYSVFNIARTAYTNRYVLII